MALHRTQRAVIYRGFVLHDGRDPIMFTEWATMDATAGEADVRKGLVNQIAAVWPDYDPEKMRIVELTWTDIDPVLYADPPYPPLTTTELDPSQPGKEEDPQ